MSIKIKKIYIILFILILINNASYCKLTSAGDFLLLGAGAKANALGGAFTSFGEGVQSLYWNPAGIYHVDKLELQVFHNMLVEDISLNYIGVVFPYKKIVLGTALQYLDYGTFKRTTFNDPFGLNTGNFTSSTLLLYLSAAIKYKKGLAGITLKTGSINLENEKSGLLLFDIGFRKKLFNNRLDAAVVLQNLGNKMKFNKKKEDIPGLFKVGCSKSLMDGFIKISSDFVKPFNDNFYISSGVSINTGRIIFNAGYKNMDSLKQEVSAGMEIKIKKILFSYCWIPDSNLGFTHQFEIVFYGDGSLITHLTK